jgi:hypothetical protein
MTTTTTRDSVRIHAICCLVIRSDNTLDEVVGVMMGLDRAELRGIAQGASKAARQMLDTDAKRGERTIYYGVCEVEMLEPLPGVRLEFRMIGEPFGRAPLDLLAHNLDKLPPSWREFTLRRIEQSN